MSPDPASYSTTTNKATMGQLSKEGLTTLQVEGKDVILATIYSRKDPLKKGSKKLREKKEREELGIM